MSGHLFIIAAPSGAGKTTLVGRLLAHDPGIHLSVSYTTRAPRPGEVNGEHYHFIDVPAFISMRDRDDFLEWAEVHGNYYGTSRAWIETQLQNNHDVLLEIDWQGAQQVRRYFPQAIGVFILPPSIGELEKRLRERGQDSDEVIARRMATAREEISHMNEFGYVIINHDLNEAFLDLCAVVRAARLTRIPAPVL